MEEKNFHHYENNDRIIDEMKSLKLSVSIRKMYLYKISHPLEVRGSSLCIRGKKRVNARVFHDRTKAEQYKDHVLQQKQQDQKMQDYESNILSHRRHHETNTNGGDADRFLYERNFNGRNHNDSYRSDFNFGRQYYHKPNPKQELNPPETPRKSQRDKCTKDFSFDIDSNFMATVAGSVDSAKSVKSSTTMISRRSVEELRRKVKSQCKLNDAIDKALKNTEKRREELEISTSDDIERVLKEHEQAFHMPNLASVQMSKQMKSPVNRQMPTQGSKQLHHRLPFEITNQMSKHNPKQVPTKMPLVPPELLLDMSNHSRLPFPPKTSKPHCRRCNDDIQEKPIKPQDKCSNKKIPHGEATHFGAADTLTLSVDDVVSSKVINPMIRRVQRMYLNNLKEEMSLMDDLERLPHKVSEVYKATILKNGK